MSLVAGHGQGYLKVVFCRGLLGDLRYGSDATTNTVVHGHHRATNNRDCRLHVLGKGRVVRALEGAGLVRLEPVGLPDPLHGAQRDAGRLGHGAPGPVGDLAGGPGQVSASTSATVPADGGSLPGGRGLIVQKAVDAFLAVALLPAPDHWSAHAGLPRDLLHCRTRLSRRQHDPGA